MELETKDRTDFYYNRFFYATMCHVCKRFDVPLMRCSGCKLISYCGTQHQRQHWAQHKPLCEAIRDVIKDEALEKLEITPDNWNYTKITLMKAVEKKKGSLELYERQMFLFPKECAVCHERNIESLVDCQNCALSFCKNHKDDVAFKDACAFLELCLRINLSVMNRQHDISKYLNTFLKHSFNMETFNTIQDMHDFINRYGKIQKVRSKMSCNILTAQFSIHLTRPLTLLYAMKVLNYVPKHKQLVIHVVAASDVEKYILKVWEVLLHFIPKTESLMIVIVGSRLNNEFRSSSVCDNCLSRGKKISLEFHNGLYEDYVYSPSFVKPDFAVGFNANIQENDMYGARITMLSIMMLAEQNCPFLLTNYTQEKLKESIIGINTILKNEIDRVYSGKNPFASLRPQRSILTRELVIYCNNFVAIYRRLCYK